MRENDERPASPHERPSAAPSERPSAAPPAEQPTLGEEVVHALTHGLGALLSVGVLVGLVAYAAAHRDTQSVVAAAVFGSSLVAVYVSSTVYHAFPASYRRAKVALQMLDHAAIHLLIAGTATPFALCGLGGRAGWIGLGVIWSLALAGIVVETTALRLRKRLSMGFYLGNGWVGALALPSLWASLPTGALSCLVLGGIAYTAGVPFFLHRRKWMHAWWHGFVLAGSALHVLAIVFLFG